MNSHRTAVTAMPPFRVKDLCKALSWETTKIKNTGLCCSELSKDTGRFWKANFGTRKPSTLSLEDPLFRACAELFCDRDDEVDGFFPKNLQAIENGYLSLPDDREEIVELLTKLFYTQEFLRQRNEELKRKNKSPKLRKTNTRSKEKDTSSDSESDFDFDENVDLTFPGLVSTGQRRQASGEMRAESSSRESITRKIVERHCGEIFSTDDQFEGEPRNIEDSPDKSIQEDPTINWLFGKGAWPDTALYFMSRCMHDREVYSSKTPEYEYAGDLTDNLLRYLRIGCNIFQYGIAHAKVSRFVMNRTREWFKEGILDEKAPNRFSKSKALEEALKARPDWVSRPQDEPETPVNQIQLSREVAGPGENAMPKMTLTGEPKRPQKRQRSKKRGGTSPVARRVRLVDNRSSPDPTFSVSEDSDIIIVNTSKAIRLSSLGRSQPPNAIIKSHVPSSRRADTLRQTITPTNEHLIMDPIEDSTQLPPFTNLPQEMDLDEVLPVSPHEVFTQDLGLGCSSKWCSSATKPVELLNVKGSQSRSKFLPTSRDDGILVEDFVFILPRSQNSSNQSEHSGQQERLSPEQPSASANVTSATAGIREAEKTAERLPLDAEVLTGSIKHARDCGVSRNKYPSTSRTSIQTAESKKPGDGKEAAELAIEASTNERKTGEVSASNLARISRESLYSHGNEGLLKASSISMAPDSLIIVQEMEKEESCRQEIERKKFVRKELERKELERKELIRQELERLQIERRELERLELKRKELERKELERKELERKELERKELERKELERKELERQDLERKHLKKQAERREVERLEAERQKMEREEMERQNAERREMERREMERREMERRKMETQAAERREIERQNGERRERERQEVERIELEREEAMRQTLGVLQSAPTSEIRPPTRIPPPVSLEDNDIQTFTNRYAPNLHNRQNETPQNRVASTPALLPTTSVPREVQWEEKERSHNSGQDNLAHSQSSLVSIKTGIVEGILDSGRNAVSQPPTIIKASCELPRPEMEARRRDEEPKTPPTSPIISHLLQRTSSQIATVPTPITFPLMSEPTTDTTEPIPPKITFIIENSKGALQFEEDKFLSPSEVKTSTVEQFFTLYSERSGKELRLIEKLTFRLIFVNNTELVIKKGDSEQSWKRLLKRIGWLFQEARASDLDETDFEVWILVGKGTAGKQRIDHLVGF